jgi:hypothetical protein
MLPFDPSILVVLLKAFLVFIGVCTVAVFAGFCIEQRSYNRQVCRRRERERRTADALRARRQFHAEVREVMGGSGGRR